MRVAILGATEVRLDGARIDLGPRKQRALIAALALHGGHAVPADTLVDLLWGEAPPAAVAATLQGYVARLRRVLEPDRAPRTPARVLVTEGTAYALPLADDALDAARFEVLVGEVHQRLGTAGITDVPISTDLAADLADLETALSLWRGMPYAELEDAPAAQAERARLEELRAVALEDRAVAALGLGRHAVVAAELEALTATYPLRERLWGLRALALARSGRQAEALEVLRQVRDLLAEELGLEPGVELRSLQASVLGQDPALQWHDAENTPPATTSLMGDRVSSSGSSWPLVGRDGELAALVELLEQSSEHPAFAVITGDPGIGKSRLCAELAAVARDSGVSVVAGRCSQDEGAPPLYPWAGILRGLGKDLPSFDGEDPADASAHFRAWESIARTVLEAAEERHVLVVLDDLHWADTSTLRVLRLLAETAQTGRLLVVATWRHQPTPTGQLAETAGMLARRHALRLPLTGLDAPEAAEIIASLTAAVPSAAEADALRTRTDGNPFFLVEYARLAHERGDLADLLAEEDPPAAVHDVLNRRIGVLPEATAQALRFACVVGRQVDLPTLAALLEVDEDAVIDVLEPALAAGLVREDGVDRFRFAHALVRDTAYAGLSRSRRGRMHARTATILAGVPGRESEVARHWLAAGPQHVGEAWRSTSTAAAAARRVYAYDEAAELLRIGLEAIATDSDATAAEHYDLLMEYAAALQLTANWVDLRPVIHRAIGIARDLDDLDRMVAAATLALTNALWQAAAHGSVDDTIVDALREALDQLPPGDSDRRCRVMLSLAGEIYYGSTPLEREALADEGVAMARRIGDPALLLWALLSASTATWRGANAERRVDLAVEATGLARGLGDQIALSTAMTLHVTAAGELGRLDEVAALLSAAREQAEAHRVYYAQIVLDAFEAAWCAVRGEFEDVDRLVADMLSLGDRTAIEQFSDALNGAVAMKMMWQGEDDALVEVMLELLRTSILPVESVVVALLCRIGRLDAARDELARHEIDLDRDNWFSPMTWSMAAELALHLDLPDLASRAYAQLTPLRGGVACAGSGTVLGPVDAFLALAARAVGERDLATRHAEDAQRLCEQWRIPLAATWLSGLRSRFDF